MKMPAKNENSHIIPQWCFNRTVHCALVLMVGIIIYSGIISAPFVFDDIIYILKNPAIRDLSVFTDLSDLDGLSLGQDIYKNIVLRPVAYLTFAINYYLGGFNVTGYHLFNIVIHLLNAVLVYHITYATIYLKAKPAGSSEIVRLTPLFSALLFVCHPAQIQSVTYVVQRFASLAAFFYLLALFFYIRSAISNSSLTRFIFYCSALLVTCIAMKTKENAFTLPLVILIYELAFFSGSRKLRLFKMLPFMLTLIIIPITVMRLEARFSGTASATVGKSMDLVNYVGVSKIDYLITQFRVVTSYLRLLVLPINQNLDYDIHLHTSFFEPQILLSFLLLAALFTAGLYLYYYSGRTSDSETKTTFLLGAFGIMWFFITLSVESTVFPLDDLMVEQRMYLPSAGFIWAFISITASACRRKSALGITIAVLTAIVAIMTITACIRNRVWKDPIVLWQDVVSKSPGKARPFVNLGMHYYAALRFNEALDAYSAAQKLNPGNFEIGKMVARIYTTLERYEEAEAAFLDLIKKQPGNEVIHFDLGYVYVMQGRPEVAASLYLHLLRMYPASMEAHRKINDICSNIGESEPCKSYSFNTKYHR